MPALFANKMGCYFNGIRHLFINIMYNKDQFKGNANLFNSFYF